MGVGSNGSAGVDDGRGVLVSGGSVAVLSNGGMVSVGACVNAACASLSGALSHNHTPSG